MLLTRHLLLHRPVVRWRFLAKCCPAIANMYNSSSNINTSNGNSFSTSSHLYLVKQPGLPPDLNKRLLKRLGFKVGEVDRGVPKGLKPVYVSSMRYFLYMGQCLQAILPPLGIIAVYHVFGQGEKSVHLVENNDFFAVDMQMFGAIAMVFVGIQVSCKDLCLN